MTVIEKNIPIQNGDNYTRLMRQMDIGDSFLIPIRKSQGMAQRAKQIGIKITQRRVSDTETRVWRIE